MKSYCKQVSVLAALAFLAVLVMPAAVLGQKEPAGVKTKAPAPKPAVPSVAKPKPTIATPPAAAPPKAPAPAAASPKLSRGSESEVDIEYKPPAGAASPDQASPKLRKGDPKPPPPKPPKPY